MFRRFYLEIIIHTARILTYYNIPEKPSENGGLLRFLSTFAAVFMLVL